MQMKMMIFRLALLVIIMALQAASDVWTVPTALIPNNPGVLPVYDGLK